MRQEEITGQEKMKIMKAIHDLLPLPLRHRKTAALFFSWSLKRKGGKEDLNFLP